MFSRQTLTLLYVTAHRVVRADIELAKTPRLRKRESIDRPASAGTLAAGVELALSLGGKVSKHTVLLTDEVWTQVVSVSDEATRGLAHAELQQLLKFESESYSELDPMTCQLGFQETETLDPTARQFWITALPGDVLLSAVQIVSSRGGRLTHVLHPAGETLGQSPRTSYLSVHGETIVALRPSGSRYLVSVRHATAGQRVVQAIEAFFEGQPSAVAVAGLGARLPVAASGRVVALDDGTMLDAWLLEWGKQIAGGLPAVPAIKAPLAETSTKTRTQIGLVATLAAVALCATQFAWAQWTKTGLEAKIAAAKEPAAQKKELDAQHAELKKQLEQVQKNLAAAQADRQTVATLSEGRNRFASLLRELSRAYQEVLVIDAIVPSATGQKLQGRSFRIEAADRLAQQLNEGLASVGWAAHPASLEGENHLHSGGPWQFTIELTELRPPTEPSQRPHTPATSTVALAARTPIPQARSQEANAEERP